MSSEKVTLGDHELDVYPQRHAYLTNKLSKYIDQIAEASSEMGDAASFVRFLGNEAYDLLIVLIPQYGKRCPKYEFLGYGSQEACDAGEYDEAEDKSPTFEEIINAFTVASRIQRFDTLKILGKVFDPNLVRGWINAQLATHLSKSVSLQSAPDGVGTLTSSGATSPTSTERTDSPSPDSKASTPHADDA
jgi:hypothetical protein